MPYMFPIRAIALTMVLACACLAPQAIYAQVTPPPPPPPPPPQPAAPAPTGPPPLWAGSLGAGLALTSGNSDTSTINLAYEVRRDGGRRVLFRSAGLYLRGETEEELSVDRALLENRVDYKLTERLSLLGRVGYLRDRFKEIDYLVSPTGGLSYMFVKTPRVEFSGDGSVGVVWEKNTGLDVDADGALLAGEKLAIAISPTARVTQAVAALWKMDDFGDSLYTFTVGVASSLTTRSELKAELLNTYQRQPPNPDVEKNDVSLLLSYIFKF